jgi:imidazole glycerol-phosphate synthase
MTHQSSGILFHTQAATNNTLSRSKPIGTMSSNATTQLTKRLVVALDVRTNDDGDLVVTKGDQYDVRERNDTAGGSNHVRNLGKPVSLAQRYYQEGADEIAFLNITSFRHGVIEDMPMLAVLEAASETIFVPLTVGGGIRSYTDPDSNKTWSALEVASRYFRAGADKVSLGSDAVDAAEHYMATGETESSIQSISHVYGAQAVVVSIDPKRVYVASPADAPQHVVVAVGGDDDDDDEKRYCWWQCTVKGGREVRDICAVTLAKAVQAMGAGEIMLNSIDMDGQCNGYDIELMRAVSEAVSIPVIASSGAGQPEHFQQVFEQTNVQAALAAGMFHRKEVEIEHVKQYLREAGIAARIT